jgi:HAT1-interacting factor 1
MTPVPTTKISFSGDAEEEEEADEGEQEEKEDDFQITWEVLDLANILYRQKLESLVAGNESSEPRRAVQRKIAEVSDLLGEVSIENGPSTLSSRLKCRNV